MKRLLILALVMFLSLMFAQLCFANTVDLNNDDVAKVFVLDCDDSQPLSAEAPKVETVGYTAYTLTDFKIVVKGQMVPSVEQVRNYAAKECLSQQKSNMRLNPNDAIYATPHDWTRVIWRHLANS